MNTLKYNIKTDHSSELSLHEQQRMVSEMELDAVYNNLFPKKSKCLSQVRLLKTGNHSMIYGTSLSDRIVVKMPGNRTPFLHLPKAIVENYANHLNNNYDLLEARLPAGWILKHKAYIVKDENGYIPIQLQEKCALYFEDQIINCCATYYELRKTVSLQQYVEFHQGLFADKGGSATFDQLIQYNWHSSKLFELLKEDDELKENAKKLLVGTTWNSRN